MLFKYKFKLAALASISETSSSSLEMIRYKNKRDLFKPFTIKIDEEPAYKTESFQSNLIIPDEKKFNEYCNDIRKISINPFFSKNFKEDKITELTLFVEDNKKNFRSIRTFVF